MRTSPTWMLPFTFRVMMRPLSRPSRTRTFTWTASLDVLRDLVGPFADLPALLREFDRLVRLVDQVLRHLEAHVHRLGHWGDLLPPRIAGRHESSALRSQRSGRRSGAAYKRISRIRRGDS